MSTVFALCCWLSDYAAVRCNVCDIGEASVPILQFLFDRPSPGPVCSVFFVLFAIGVIDLCFQFTRCLLFCVSSFSLSSSDPFFHSPAASDHSSVYDIIYLDSFPYSKQGLLHSVLGTFLASFSFADTRGSAPDGSGPIRQAFQECTWNHYWWQIVFSCSAGEGLDVSFESWVEFGGCWVLSGFEIGRRFVRSNRFHSVT